MAEAPAGPLKKTPLHAEHVRLGARMTPFGGWDMPLQYGGQLAEHHAVRQNVGIFDVSHMGQVRFHGARTLDFLMRLVPANVARLADGGSIYTQLTNSNGGVIDDLIISRLRADEYFAVVNASTKDKDIAWMRNAASELGYFDVAIDDESERFAMIAVQGPRAFDVLDRVIPGREWANTPAFTLHRFVANNESHFLSRTGYTGEVGAEILSPPHHAAEWWNRLLDAGALPCGLAARDSLRLEAGYCLYGNDLDDGTTPVEANLSWSVGWKKTERYYGREVLEQQKASGAPRRLVGLKGAGRRPFRHGEKVALPGGHEVGVVTSGGYSPVLECGIALAYVDAGYNEPGTALVVQVRGTDNPVTVVKTPFVKTSLSKD